MIARAIAASAIACVGACDATSANKVRPDGDTIYAACDGLSWSPDGARLALTYATRDEGFAGLYTINADGSGLTLPLESGAPPDDVETVEGDRVGVMLPAWSPDGRQIVFHSLVAVGVDWEHQLFAIDVATREVRPLAGEALPGGGAAWSPDGARIVFTGGEPPSQGLYELTLATGAVRLLPGGAEGVAAAFAPDGETLAFTIDHLASEQLHYRQDDIMLLRDGAVTPFVQTTGASESDPAFSPDGRQIAFISGDGRRQSLAVAAAAGGAQQALLDGRGGELMLRAFAWSPDGDRIAYCAAGDARVGLYIMSVDGADRRGLIQADAT